MKAIRIHGKGDVNQLAYEEAPDPTLKEGDVLVRVFASSFTKTELEWDQTYENDDGSVRALPIPGHELAGIVVKTGSGRTDLSPGDKVYGLTSFDRDGTLAEFVAVKGEFLAPLPSGLDHAMAAAATLAGLTAWQALFDHGELKAGQKVLIHGAAGGVGTYAVQLAKWAGATVVATVSTADVGFVKGLGADHVIDYTKQSFDDMVQDVDVVLDPIGGETRDRSWRTLRKGGILVTIASPLNTSNPGPADRRGVFFVVTPSRKELVSLAGLLEKKIVTPFVDQTFSLEETKKAFESLIKEHHRGKTVVRVAI
jgi:NADPH:quinone reductase-like Zn-dependent oxidoreductase